jgi:hypothetical protein
MVAVGGTVAATKFIPTGSSATGNGMYLPAANELGFSTNGSEGMRLNSTGLLIGLSSALANGKLQVAGSIGLSGNTQIRQATNSDGNTLQLFATQVVVGNANSTSYGYTGGGLLGSFSNQASAITLDVGGATAGHRLQVVNDGTGVSGILNYSNAGTSRFYVNSDTGNVGIGTSSPDSKLHVLNSTVASLRIGFNGTSFNFYDADTQIFRSGNDTERMRLDSSGNLGLGVVPSGQSKFEVYTGNTTLNGVTSRFNGSNPPIALASTTSNGFPYL